MQSSSEAERLYAKTLTEHILGMYWMLFGLVARYEKVKRKKENKDMC